MLAIGAAFKRLSRSLLVFISVFITSIALISCGNFKGTNYSDLEFSRTELAAKPKPFRESEIYFERDSNKMKQLINEKIRYLAIGDSVSQGFMAIPFAAGPGSFDGKDVKGSSFPAYLADLINRSQRGKLESFKNLSLSGSRVIDWLYVLDKQGYPQYRESFNRKFEINELISRNRISNFKDNLEYFDEKLDHDFSRLREEVRRANLITIGLGGNSALFSIINYSKKLWSFLTTHPLSSVTAKDIDKIIKDSIKDMEYVMEQQRGDYINLVNLIRGINKDVRIVLIGYPSSPVLNIEEVLAFFFKASLRLLPRAFFKVRETIKNVARITNVSFINLYSNRTLDKDMMLSSSFLDFHPGTKVAKWMAQQIFLKIAMPIDIFKSYLSSYRSDVRGDWLGSYEDEYLSYDLGSFRKEIYLNQVADQKIAWIAKERFDDYWASEKLFTFWLFRNPKAPDYINDMLRRTNYFNLQWFINGIRSAVSTLPTGGNISSNGLRGYIVEQWERLRKNPVFSSKLYDFKVQLNDFIHTVKEIFVSNDKKITFVNVSQRWLEVANDPVILTKLYHLWKDNKDIFYTMFRLLLPRVALLSSVKN